MLLSDNQVCLLHTILGCKITNFSTNNTIALSIIFRTFYKINIL